MGAEFIRIIIVRDHSSLAGKEENFGLGEVSGQWGSGQGSEVAWAFQGPRAMVLY